MRFSPVAFFFILLVFSVSLTAQKPTDNWPSFRGYRAQGTVQANIKMPQSWSVPDNKNVKWRVPIPGLAHSCPIVWGDRVFITTAINSKGKSELKLGLYGNIAPVKNPPLHSWYLYCLDRQTGKLIWKYKCHEGIPQVKRHTKATHANSTPTTDGKYIVAFFGSEGLFCLDMEGKRAWVRNFGLLDSGFFRAPRAQWGFASSPIIHENKVIIQCDVQKNSFIAALDLKTGKTLWRTARTEVPTWSTPTVHVGPEQTQIIVNGFKHIGGYDLATGKELWKLNGGGDIPVPTPVIRHGLIFITNAHGPGSPIYAIKPEAKDNISLEQGEQTNQHIKWSVPRGGGYMQTPIVYQDHFYTCRDNGVLSCYEAKTGQLLYKERLGRATGFTASPVAGDGKLYFAGESGEVVVVKAGEKFQVLSRNLMGGSCMATPAISGGNLIFRTRDHLVSIGK